MSKTLRYILLGLILSLGAGLLLFTLTIDSIVSSGIEEIGSEMTGTPVTVESVSISPFSGSGTISGFTVANPEGYAQDSAIEIESFSIILEPFSLFSDEIIVNQITINGASIFVEQQLPENNIREIMDHLNSLPEGEASDATLVIEQFVLENSRADLYTEVGGERSAQVEISRIELNDLGRVSNSATAQAVVKQIAEKVAGESLEAAAESGAGQIRDTIKDFFN